MLKSSGSIALLISGLLSGVISSPTQAMLASEEEPQGARPKAVVACKKNPVDKLREDNPQEYHQKK